jgi:hypothetical protein
MFKCKIWLAGASTFWWVASAAGAQGRIHLTVVHDSRDVSAPNSVAVTLLNSTDHDIFIYGYNSAFEMPEGRTTSNWFDVSDAFGHSVQYKGRFVYSGPPQPSAFLRIGPGTSLYSKVDLAREYELPVGGAVNVSTDVAVYERIPQITRDGESESLPHTSVKSNVVTFAVVQVANIAKIPSSAIQCTSAQTEATGRAISAAQHIAEAGTNFLAGLYYIDEVDEEDPLPPRVHMTPNRRYQDWFGTWDDGAPQYPDLGYLDTDNARIDQTIFATHVRLLSGVATVCDQCVGYHPSARAWAEGKLVHLCPVNFGDPITGGITSQAGTIVHEVSHQNDDMAKGTVDVKDVSSRAEAHALPRHTAASSAANYEYFITNTPLGRRTRLRVESSPSR